MGAKAKSKEGPERITTNRRARHAYEILDTVEAGIELRGPEVKSLRAGQANLTDGFAFVRGGEMFLRGLVGERFCVRNSGATAVVEGVGDHGCEYMTGGSVVVLGQTGRNFAAGMSGGIAYVLDINGDFSKYCNPSMVTLEPLLAESEQEAKLVRELWHGGVADETIVKKLIGNHARYTGSAQAQHILARWSEFRPKFVKVFPHEYRRALGELAAKQRRQAA